LTSACLRSDDFDRLVGWLLGLVSVPITIARDLRREVEIAMGLTADERGRNGRGADIQLLREVSRPINAAGGATKP
jgi:hypothetical protein